MKRDVVSCFTICYIMLNINNKHVECEGDNRMAYGTYMYIPTVNVGMYMYVALYVFTELSFIVHTAHTAHIALSIR